MLKWGSAEVEAILPWRVSSSQSWAPFGGWMGVCRAENEKVGVPAREEKTWRVQSVCGGAEWRAAYVSIVEEVGLRLMWLRRGPRCRQLHSRAVGLRPHHERGREVKEEDSLKTIALESWLWQQCGEWLEKDKTGANETSLAIGCCVPGLKWEIDVEELASGVEKRTRI